MRVIWLGIDDTGGCVLHWHELRLELAKHGVELMGPGYSWEGKKTLSELLREVGTPDWIVLDDCNAKGYVPIKWDCEPDCKVAVREHDWWNRHRFGLHERIAPDLTMGCYDRPMDTQGRSRPGWTLVPHAVNTERFCPNGEERQYAIGFYGKHGKMYEHRTRARREIMKRKDAWVGTHGGYWHDGTEHNDGVHTFYNDNLAAKLRQCKMLWVDSPDNFGACVLKYLEAAASGCVLIGEVPFRAVRLVPYMSQVEPEDIHDKIAHFLSLPTLHEYGVFTRRHAKLNHSLPVRAREIVELLESEL